MIFIWEQGLQIKFNSRLRVEEDTSIHCTLTSISLWLMVVLSLVTSWARSDLCLTSSSSLSSARFFSPYKIYHVSYVIVQYTRANGQFSSTFLH